MKFQVLCVLSAVLICSEATYGKYGSYGYGLGGLGYGLGGLGYGIGGQGYGVPVIEKAPVAYTVPGVGYNTIPLGRSAYSAPLDPSSYGILYDEASAYAVLDPAYGAYSRPLKYGYGSAGLLGQYGYALKK